MNFSIDFSDMRNLMTQSQCVELQNELLRQNRLLGWILLGFALLVILLAAYCIMKQKDIMRMEKEWQPKKR